ncbi:MAG: sulfur carrier protein ThiS adenylyltransferase ThiF [Clostridia bacterium]|nr:sulfur carrier protein ThiS adenylyltransferase ThiF [Clostridia bacterium]
MKKEEIKEILSKSKVAVAGLGGLGSNIAVMLARSGVGHLRLIDFDVVEESNLNRQAYSLSDIGKPKAGALLEILNGINPKAEYEIFQLKITPDNVEELFRGFPVVCEALDSAQEKAMLVREVLLKCPGATVVSGNGMVGFGAANEIVTEQKMKRLYVCGDFKTGIEDTDVILAPRVMICAGHQANKAIELILEGK